jgi:predicted RNA-binding protein associated with RNAse of E/G family
MTDQPEVTIEYIRPGKDVTEYREDLLAENEQYIRTFKVFPEAIITSLTASLRKNGFISNDQTTTSITKIYFFHEHFDLLLFHDEQGEILGYYSDIGTPLIKTANGYQMTDWFLDIWLSPDGTLFELDIDEFEEALSKNLLSTTEAEIARNTFARLIHDARQGIYPQAYMK